MFIIVMSLIILLVTYSLARSQFYIRRIIEINTLYRYGKVYNYKSNHFGGA